MTEKEFRNALKNLNSSRESRLKQAQIVKNDMSLFPYLIAMIFKVDDKISYHAAWVLEFVCADNIDVIIPHLDTFTENIHRFHFDSAIRPISKICVFMANAYISKEDNELKKFLLPKYRERIVETCFDWLINKHKVAPKVFAMETLFILGHESSWIHNDLKQILEQDFTKQSAAFKSRAKHILIRLKKISKA